MRRSLESILFAVCFASAAFAQQTDIKTIKRGIETLRQVPGDKRGGVTRQLAVEIRTLPPGRDKVILADQLAHLSTEGQEDPGVIQEAATTLSSALKEFPIASKSGKPVEPYYELAKLVWNEGAIADITDPQYIQSMDLLKQHDGDAAKADFTLEGFNLQQLGVKKVTLSQLRGKIVLVNFWATWCPPCRTEMPNLQAISDHFKDQLVVLAITDEPSLKVASYAAGYKFPILFDPGRKAASDFHVDGIPQTFVFDRDGKLAAHAIDMSTQRQFLAMLTKAGLKSE